MALWITNFVILDNGVNASHTWWIVTQLCMIGPIMFVVPSLGYVAETMSLLSSVVDLNLAVLLDSLKAMQDQQELINQLREKVYSRIERFEVPKKNVSCFLFLSTRF